MNGNKLINHGYKIIAGKKVTYHEFEEDRLNKRGRMYKYHYFVIGEYTYKGYFEMYRNRWYPMSKTGKVLIDRYTNYFTDYDEWVGRYDKPKMRYTESKWQPVSYLDYFEDNGI